MTHQECVDVKARLATFLEVGFADFTMPELLEMLHERGYIILQRSGDWIIEFVRIVPVNQEYTYAAA